MLSTHIGRRRKFGEVSCMECTGESNDFELILTVEMETRNPIEGYFGQFGGEFPAICNRVMVVRSHKMLKILRNFCVF